MPGGMLLGVDAAAPSGGTAESIYSLSFDGSTGYVSIDGFAPSISVFTVAFWAKANSLSGYRSVLGGGGGSQALTFASGVFEWYNGGDRQSSYTLATGSWHHFAVSCDGTTLSFFVDGSPAGTYASAGSLLPFGTGVLLGANVSGIQIWSGLLDDFAVFYSALSSGQIAAIYAAGSPLSYDPAGFWRFEEGMGTTTADSSGNGNTGMFSGGVTWSSDVPAQLM